MERPFFIRRASPLPSLAVLLVAMFAIGPAAAPKPGTAEDPGEETECVVLLHGLWRTELSMLDMERELENAGYAVANVTYPSLFHSIPELAERAVAKGLEQCHEAGHERIDFVTHSLGGLLVRQYLSHETIGGLHRVVMLGPPNQGSQLADYVSALRLPRWLQPASLAELGTGEDAITRQLRPVDFELGVIAGNTDPILSWPGAPEAASDGVVTVEETRVAGMVDFIELPASHTFMMWSSVVQEQVLYFLKHGRFDHGSSGRAP